MKDHNKTKAFVQHILEECEAEGFTFEEMSELSVELSTQIRKSRIKAAEVSMFRLKFVPSVQE